MNFDLTFIFKFIHYQLRFVTLLYKLNGVGIPLRVV